jgi:MFS family permease
LFLRHKPQELGLYPDGLKGVEPQGKGGPEVKDSKGSETGWTLKMAFRTKSFWALLFFAASVMLGLYMIHVHHFKFLVDMGIGKMTAAFFFALIGVISSIFRIFWGWLSDRIGREKTYTLGVISLCMGVGSLILMDITGEKALVYFFVIFFGIGWGVTAPLIMAAAADLFKGRGFGLIYGIVEGCVGVGGAFGVWVGGFIFDKTLSYYWAFLLAIAAIILSCLFIWLAAPRKMGAGRE